MWKLKGELLNFNDSSTRYAIFKTTDTAVINTILWVKYEIIKIVVEVMKELGPKIVCSCLRPMMYAKCADQKNENILNRVKDQKPGCSRWNRYCGKEINHRERNDC